MGFEDLTELDRRVYEYIKRYDFETYKWNTPAAARELGATEQEVYQALCNLAKHVKDNIWIHYKDGGIRISAE